MSQAEPLRGVYSPVLTPFDDDLNPDVDRFIAHCKRLLDDGCHGLAVFGTTSEANSLSAEERMHLLEALVAAGIPAEVMIPGTGCSALSDSARLTAHAVKLGCGGVLMLPPFYYKAINDDGLFKSFAEVIQRVGDDRLRIYLYHIPPVANVPFSLELVERLVKAYPETVVGLKDSSGDWSYTEALLKALPGFGAFSGSEIFLLDNLRAGGAGTISATANVNGAAIRHLFDNWQNDDADDLQAAITRRRKLIQSYPMIPALKQITAARAGDPGWGAMRPPLLPLSAAETTKLLAELTEDGYPLGAAEAAAA